MPIGDKGEVKGSLTLTSSGLMIPQDILKFHPEIQVHLDDVVKQGWKYLYIEARGKSIAQVAVENSSYHMGPAPASMMKSKVAQARGFFQPELMLEVYLGPNPPEVEGVPEVQEFRVNVSSKSFPRAATVDLANGVVTYLHDPFWRWEKGWEADEKKLSDAREVYDIATWLLDVKKFKLIEVFKPERYQELKGIFHSMSL
jgi:hypothetical protein